jgi:hypothetical protein
MMKTTIALCVLVGCSSPTPAGPATDTGIAEAATDSGAPPGDTAVEEKATISGEVRGVSGRALSAVRVTALGRSESTATDSTGQYLLLLPVGLHTKLRFEKMGFVPIIAPFELGRKPLVDSEVLATDDEATALTKVVTAARPWPATDVGLIAVRTFTGPRGTIATSLAGATIALVEKAGKGPVYADAAGNPDLSLTATSSSGLAYFFDLPPGDRELEITHPGHTCDDHVWSWNGSMPQRTLVPVTAGALATPSINCP